MWGSFIGLVLLLQSVMLANGVFDGTDYSYYIDSSRDLIINSPGYPNKYTSGTDGRYTVKTADTYEIVINCTINIDKTSTGCGTESFYISLDADSGLRGAELYCGSGNIVRVSEYSKISMAYVSKAARGSGVGGTFSCRIYVRIKACDCGWSQRGRIIGGTNAEKTEFPSTVGIGEKASGTVFCDGSIISPTAVVTAAHCVEPYKDPSKIFILAGYTYLPSTTSSGYDTTYLVFRIIVYPGYSPTTQLYDIALLLTSQKMEWSRGIGPICLPLDTPPSAFEYYNALLVGWGTTSFGGPRSNILLKAAVSVIPNSDCRRQYPNIQPSQVCTYANGRDACQFDSGGPVIFKGAIREYLIAIISYGRECGGTTAGVNIRVTDFISWIRQNIVDTLCYKPMQ